MAENLNIQSPNLFTIILHGNENYDFLKLYGIKRGLKGKVTIQGNKDKFIKAYTNASKLKNVLLKAAHEKKKELYFQDNKSALKSEAFMQGKYLTDDELKELLGNIYQESEEEEKNRNNYIKQRDQLIQEAENNYIPSNLTGAERKYHQGRVNWLTGKGGLSNNIFTRGLTLNHNTGLSVASSQRNLKDQLKLGLDERDALYKAAQFYTFGNAGLASGSTVTGSLLTKAALLSGKFAVKQIPWMAATTATNKLLDNISGNNEQNVIAIDTKGNSHNIKLTVDKNGDLVNTPESITDESGNNLQIKKYTDSSGNKLSKSELLTNHWLVRTGVDATAMALTSTNPLNYYKLASNYGGKEALKALGKNIFINNAAMYGYAGGNLLAPDNYVLLGILGTAAGLAAGKLTSPGKGYSQFAKDVYRSTKNKQLAIAAPAIVNTTKGTIKTVLGGLNNSLIMNTGDFISNYTDPQTQMFIQPILQGISFKALNKLLSRLKTGVTNATVLGIMLTGNSQLGKLPMFNAIESMTGVRPEKKTNAKVYTKNLLTSKLTPNGKLTVRSFIEPLNPFKEPVPIENYVLELIDNHRSENNLVSQNVRRKGLYTGLVHRVLITNPKTKKLYYGINYGVRMDMGRLAPLNASQVLQSPIGLMIAGVRPERGTRTLSGYIFNTNESNALLKSKVLKDRVKYLKDNYGNIPLSEIDFIYAPGGTNTPENIMFQNGYEYADRTKYPTLESFKIAKQQYEQSLNDKKNFALDILTKGKDLGLVDVKNEFLAGNKSQYANNTTGNHAHIIEYNGKLYSIHSDVFKINSKDYNKSHAGNTLTGLFTAFAENNGRPTIHFTSPKELTPSELKNLQIHKANNESGTNDKFASLLKTYFNKGNKQGDLHSTSLMIHSLLNGSLSLLEALNIFEANPKLYDYFIKNKKVINNNIININKARIKKLNENKDIPIYEKTLIIKQIYKELNLLKQTLSNLILYGVNNLPIIKISTSDKISIPELKKILKWNDSQFNHYLKSIPINPYSELKSGMYSSNSIKFIKNLIQFNSKNTKKSTLALLKKVDLTKINDVDLQNRIKKRINYLEKQVK